MQDPFKPTWDVAPDTWTATDALGRTLPGHEECGPPREGRYAGVFYFLWHGRHGTEGPFDITRILAANPDDPPYGPPGAMHHWGEPEHGFYISTDRWVHRRNAYMLADAGIDTLIFDGTNAFAYLDALDAVCSTLMEIRADGERTPQICYLAHQKTIETVYQEFYSKGRYEELWFRWKGKPLILFGQDPGPHGAIDPARLSPEIQAFFTIRKCWAWDMPVWYDDGRDAWPWVAHTPQNYGWHEDPNRAEQVCVCIAEHPATNIGRSFHDGSQPETDRYMVTPDTPKGLYFSEQWAHALQLDPEFLFITGWNEWIAGRFITEEPRMLGGRRVEPGGTWFVDQYNSEYSRDAEPVRGQFTDNYYYQMIAGIRRYKGVRAPEPASAPKTIDLAGGWEQWADVAPEYRDHRRETVHRDEPGWGDAGRLVNTSGRNEFVSAKVTRDGEHVFFHIVTREAISPHTDPNWMMLFINVDRSDATGWQGYNFVVNMPPLSERRTSIRQYDDATGEWRAIGETEYRVEGTRLMLAAPLELLRLDPRAVRFDFKWVDNADPTDIEDWFIHGDTAPNRRFAYRYSG